MEIQLLEGICKKYEFQQENKDSYEESIVEVPKTFIYHDEETNEESIQEIEAPNKDISKTKIQNSRTFYRKDFDPRVFEQSRNTYKTFLKLVKESGEKEKTPTEYTSPVSPEVNLGGTTVPPEILKNRYFTKTTRKLKNHSNVCWYDLHNICKFGKNCRNRHISNSQKENYNRKHPNQQTSNTTNLQAKFRPKVPKPMPENHNENYRSNQNIQNQSLYNGYDMNFASNKNGDAGDSGSKSQTLGVTGYHSVPYAGDAKSGDRFVCRRGSAENGERGIRF